MPLSIVLTTQDRISNAGLLLAMAVSAVWTGSGRVAAGTVELSGGGFLAGQVREVDKESADYVIVQVDPEMSVAVAGVHVRRAIEDAELAEYRGRVQGAVSAEDHYELSRWCKQANLLHQAQYHLNRVVDIDPDHKRARAALGYVRHEGEWVSYAALKRSQGLVQDKTGRWVIPELLVSRQQADEVDRQAKQWIRQLGRLQTRAMRGDAEAMAEIEAIDDPLASEAIARELQRTRKSASSSRPLRMTYLRLLGRFRTSSAVAALVEAGVRESDAMIREEALRLLSQYGHQSAVATYLPMLKSSQPSTVKAAARALLYFPDAELAFEYIDALTTTQKVRQQIGGGTQAGFSNSGSAGLSNGSRIIERERTVQNPEILGLLKEVAPGVDFGYDKTAWREYFSGLRSAGPTNLRRD